MLLYHGKTELKEKLIARARDHRLSDRITQGIYWEPFDDDEWHGCAIGCLASDASVATHVDGIYSRVELTLRIKEDFAIPYWLMRLAEAGFEGAPEDEAAKWPEEFAAAIPVGVELEDTTCREWYHELVEKFGDANEDDDLERNDTPWVVGARQFVLDKLRSITPDDQSESIEGIVAAVEARAAAEKRATQAIGAALAGSGR